METLHLHIYIKRGGRAQEKRRRVSQKILRGSQGDETMNNTSQKVLISIGDQNKNNWFYIYSMHIPQIGDHIFMSAGDGTSMQNWKAGEYGYNRHNREVNKEYEVDDVVLDGVVTKREWLYQTTDFIKITDKNKKAEKGEELVVHITLG